VRSAWPSPPWRRPAAALGAAPRVECPAANPIVDENWCTPSATWSDAFQLGAGGKDTDSPNKDGHLLLYPTETSVDRGEAVDLAVASYNARITKTTLSVSCSSSPSPSRSGGPCAASIERTSTPA
jgi:hypothetical protein